MAGFERITSLQNTRIKAYSRLQDRRERRKTGLMLVEGYNELRLALDSGRTDTDCLLYCPELARPGECQPAELVHPGLIVEVSSAVMSKLAYREHPDAWLAVVRIPVSDFSALDGQLLKAPSGVSGPGGATRSPKTGQSGLYIVTEDLEKPGNLGAILRSADACGADGIIVCEGRTDIYNPNVVRASKGSLFTLPVVETENAAAIAWLRSRKIRILAASPDGASDYWSADLTGPIAFAVGAEKEGLSSFWLEHADACVRIPMAGTVNSLNVAQAATVLLYEALRQRNLGGGLR